ncbi:PREDICTED: pectin acetylesterase 8-like [Ipomoea nil]|uniref:pectin acetylesterase 8-like n=1 Tax=Ipomoea nil TaxID=35883 RepID=UPI000901447B|nr:PREDICTED: pectin acetylesterase 8-like [Ipomoea nil]XP_019166136.1 PREDICTED: pectin acetylesterase 8-like [Ipomoea nil]
MGDTEIVHNGTKLYFRGERIFNAVMQELLQKGMGKAKNALLAGSSARGIAATLYCDRFRGLLPNACRVKCLSDAAYFFPSRRFKDDGDLFIPYFKGLIAQHGSVNSLPKSCTSRLSPYLCFFPQNVQQDIKTPIFFLMSAFDKVQINYIFPKHKETITACLHSQNCSTEMIKAMQELRLELLSVLPKQDNTSSRGILITSETVHEQIRYLAWNSNRVVDGSNETISKMFTDWYFDGKVVQVIDKYLCPYNCSHVQDNI